MNRRPLPEKIITIPLLSRKISLYGYRRQEPIPEFVELRKAWIVFFDEVAKAMRLREICEFLEKVLRREVK